MKPINKPYSIAIDGRLITSHGSLPEAVDAACNWGELKSVCLPDMTITHIDTRTYWTLEQAAHLCRQPVLPDPNALSRFAPHAARWFSVIPFPHPIMPKNRWSANVTYHNAEPTSCFCIGDKPQRHWMFAPTPWQLSTADWNLTPNNIEGYDYFQPYAYPLDGDNSRMQGINGLTINHVGHLELVPWRGATG